MWRHTRRGDRYVTVIIDLTPVRDRSGPARLLDVVPGRSKKVLKTWLSQRDQDWRGRVEVVAMDGFTGSRERCRRGAPTGPGGDGSLSCRGPGGQQARPVPPPDPAGDHRATGPGR